MPTLSIIIPVYYNEESLPFLFDELLKIEKSLLEKSMELELIFVDDGSGDNSIRELLKIKQQRLATRVIKLTRNFGAVHASKTGFQFVTGDCFLILAADLQDPPELILEMVEKWQAGAKFVMATRSDRDDPAGSKVFSYLYYKLLRHIVISNYPDGGYDMALMDKTLLPYLQKSSKNMYTPLLAYWLGFQPEVISYRRRKRIYGRSRWTFGKKLTAAIDALFGFSYIPIRFISLIGLIVSIASFAYAIWILINGFLGRTEVRGFATLVTLVAFLQGLGIFMLGIIGEYVWRIFDEVNHRPETVIDAVY
jgi:polyisoprenyl-phosphate glycosyltransferase